MKSFHNLFAVLVTLTAALVACPAAKEAAWASLDAACIAALKCEPPEAIAVACKLEQTLIPVLRELVAARKVGACTPQP